MKFERVRGSPAAASQHLLDAFLAGTFFAVLVVLPFFPAIAPVPFIDSYL
jgi:hypothetical protein